MICSLSHIYLFIQHKDNRRNILIGKQIIFLLGYLSAFQFHNRFKVAGWLAGCRAACNATFGCKQEGADTRGSCSRRSCQRTPGQRSSGGTQRGLRGQWPRIHSLHPTCNAQFPSGPAVAQPLTHFLAEAQDASKISCQASIITAS